MLHIVPYIMAYDTAITMTEVVTDLPLFGHDQPASEREMLRFVVRTYGKLRANRHDIYEEFWGVTNRWLDLWSDDDQRALYQFYLNARRLLNTLPDIEGNEAVPHELGRQFLELVIARRLDERALAHVIEADLPVPRDREMRVQDTEEMTFYEPQHRVLIALTLFAKLLAPIWGEYIHRTQAPGSGKDDSGLPDPNEDPNTSDAIRATRIRYVPDFNKEIMCLIILEGVMQLPLFVAVCEKFRNYMRKSVLALLNRQNDGAGQRPLSARFALSLFGCDEQRLLDWNLAQRIVKNLPQINLMLTSSNVMRVTNYAAKFAVEQRLSAISAKAQVRQRIDPSESNMAGTDKMSLVELDTKPSRYPADTTVLLSVGVMRAIPDLLRDFGVPEAIFTEMVEHYQRRLVQVSILSRAVVGAVVGRYIGGERGIPLLELPDYAALLSVTQAHLALEGHEELAHLISANTPSTPRTEMPSAVEVRLATAHEGAPEYKQVRELYSLHHPRGGAARAGSLAIDQHMVQLREWIQLHTHTYNTPSALALLLGHAEPVTYQGRIQLTDDLLLVRVCRVYLEQHRRLLASMEGHKTL